MSEMIANRYLLNEKPDRAIRLYREAIDRGEDTTCNRCRLVAACLVDGRSREALQELLLLMETEGLHALDLIKHECQSFLPKSMKPAFNEPLARALWLVLDGQHREARRTLSLASTRTETENKRETALLLELLNGETGSISKADDQSGMDDNQLDRNIERS